MKIFKILSAFAVAAAMVVAHVDAVVAQPATPAYAAVAVPATSSTAYAVSQGAKGTPLVAPSPSEKVPTFSGTSAHSGLTSRSWWGIGIGAVIAVLLILFAPGISPWIGLVIGVLWDVTDEIIGDYVSRRFGEAWSLIRSRIRNRAPWWLSRLV